MIQGGKMCFGAGCGAFHIGSVIHGVFVLQTLVVRRTAAQLHCDTHTHTQTYTHTHTHMHTRTHTQTHTQTYTHTQTHTQTYTHTCTHRHTHTCTHTRTHTNTHALPARLGPILSFWRRRTMFAKTEDLIEIFHEVKPWTLSFLLPPPSFPIPLSSPTPAPPVAPSLRPPPPSPGSD